MRITRQTGVSASRRISNLAVAFGLAATAYGFQTISIANQDIAELAGIKSDKPWLIHLEQPQGSSIVSASMVGSVERVSAENITHSISSDLTVSDKVFNKADPQRINRAIKGDRVVQTTAKKAPKDFSAGSVLERHSILRNQLGQDKLVLAFVEPKPAVEALQVAAAFHPNKPKRDPFATDHLPTMVASLVKRSESNVLAYAPEPEKEYSPFSAVLVEEKPIKIVPKLGRGDHAWADDPLPKSSFSKKQQRCLAEGIYFEARGEPVSGQAAVSQVILNRVRNPHYPNTICGVVYQNKHWRNRCQFSFACDRIRDRVRDKKSWAIAQHVATETTAGRIWFSEVGSSTHYHATYVNPRWAHQMKKVGKIGLHLFYRTKNGGWS